jgi:RNA recognition motif-containing protein
VLDWLLFIYFKLYFMNIFVAKLNFDTRDSDLQNAFEDFGSVDSVKIIMDKFTGRSKGYGFVEMPNDEEGQNAINGLNDTELDGRTIVVKKAEPRENRDSRGGGGYRGGGGGGSRDGGYNKRY